MVPPTYHQFEHRYVARQTGHVCGIVDNRRLIRVVSNTKKRYTNGQNCSCTYNCCNRIELLWKSAIANTQATNFFQARFVRIVITWIVNHTFAHNRMQDGEFARTWYFCPHNCINMPGSQQFLFEDEQTVSMGHAPSLPLNTKYICLNLNCQ